MGNIISVFIIGKKNPNLEEWLEAPNETLFLTEKIFTVEYYFDSVE
jgi:hypothetical protein